MQQKKSHSRSSEKRHEIETEEKDQKEEGKMEEKVPKRTIFNDLASFKDQKVTILTYGGSRVEGLLLSYDEIANCVIQLENRNKTVVFGKSISFVCDGSVTAI